MKSLFTRNNLVWELSFWSGVFLFAASLTNLVPVEYAGKVKDLGALLGFMGKMANSPLPKGES